MACKKKRLGCSHKTLRCSWCMMRSQGRRRSDPRGRGSTQPPAWDCRGQCPACLRGRGCRTWLEGRQMRQGRRPCTQWSPLQWRCCLGHMGRTARRSLRPPLQRPCRVRTGCNHSTFDPCCCRRTPPGMPCSWRRTEHLHCWRTCPVRRVCTLVRRGPLQKSQGRIRCTLDCQCWGRSCRVGRGRRHRCRCPPPP